MYALRASAVHLLWNVILKPNANSIGLTVSRWPEARSAEKMWSSQQILPNNKQHETNVISNATFVPYSWTDPWKCFLSRHKDNLTVLIEHFMRIIIIWFLFLKGNPWGIFALLRWQQIWGFTLKSPAVINNCKQTARKMNQKHQVQPKMRRTIPLNVLASKKKNMSRWAGFLGEQVSALKVINSKAKHLKQRLWPTKGQEKESRWSLLPLHRVS